MFPVYRLHSRLPLGPRISATPAQARCAAVKQRVWPALSAGHCVQPSKVEQDFYEKPAGLPGRIQSKRISHSSGVSII